MADQNTTPRAESRIPIKRLNGVENMNGATINHILDQIWTWIHDFYDLSSGHRKVKSGFPVKHFASDEFDLSTSKDLINGIVPFEATQPFLFISDLVGFVEQIRTSLSSSGAQMNIGGQCNELSNLSKTFALLGIDTDGHEISIENLAKLDDPKLTELRNRALERIVEMQKILRPLIKADEKVQSIEEIHEEEAPKEGAANVTLIAAGLFASGQTSDGPEGGADETPNHQRQPRPDNPNRPPEQPPAANTSPTPLRLSELSGEDKLYVQSLSIITINQALQKYFPDKSVTFDNLPFAIRQQLMERSSTHVYNMLLSGKQGFELSQLIRNPGSRLRFGDECAIDLLLDIQGVNTLSNFLKEYRANPTIATDSEQLATLVDSEKQSVLSEKQADDFLDKQAEQHDNNFFDSLLGVIGDSKNLDETLLREFSQITGGKDLGRTKLLLDSNLIPTIEAFIQEGLPPSFLISNDRLDYSKFKKYFGSDLIDEKVFKTNEAQVVLLIKSYWLRKRAIWARDIRREVAQERISEEEAIKLYNEIASDKKLLDRHAKQIALLRSVNQTYGGERITKIIAGQEDPQAIANDPILALYQEAQKESHLNFFQEFLQKEGLQGGDAGIMEVFVKFYLPAAAASQFTLTTTTTIGLNQVGRLFSPYDLFSINANNSLGTNFGYRDGQSSALMGYGPMNGSTGQSTANNGIGGKVAREALKWGMRGALGAATGGASEAAFLEWEALKKADPTGLAQMVEDTFLNQTLEKLKKLWPALLLGAIAPFLPLLSVLGGLLLAARNLEAIKNFLGLGKSNLASSAGTGSGMGSYSALEREALASQQAQAIADAKAAAAAAAPTTSPAMAIAGQAVLYTSIGSAAFVFLYYANLNSAFLTHFPFNEAEVINTVEKTSKYAEMKKTAKIVKGCFATENDGSKCEKPNFPVAIEYTIVIKTKEDFAIQITDITDTIKFRQSKEAWNDNPPPIPAEQILNMDYFLPIIAGLGALSSTGLDPTSSDIINEDPLQPTTDPSQQFIVLQPGQQLSFSYTLDDLGSNYNHTAIVNTIDVKFNYQNAVEAGSDMLKTAARVCLGDCGAGAGCWPTNGIITQLPFGSYSHGPPSTNTWFDAYDIACGSACSYKALYGPPVYARYDGNLCFKGCSDSGYGCYYILEFELDGQKNYELYAHFEEPNPQLSVPNTCQQVEAGFMISLMGTRGNSTNTHLHFGLTTSYGSGFASNPGFSTLTELVPPDNGGNHPPQENQSVTTCYQ